MGRGISQVCAVAVFLAVIAVSKAVETNSTKDLTKEETYEVPLQYEGSRSQSKSQSSSKSHGEGVGKGYGYGEGGQVSNGQKGNYGDSGEHDGSYKGRVEYQVGNTGGANSYKENSEPGSYEHAPEAPDYAGSYETNYDKRGGHFQGGQSAHSYGRDYDGKQDDDYSVQYEKQTHDKPRTTGQYSSQRLTSPQFIAPKGLIGEQIAVVSDDDASRGGSGYIDYGYPVQQSYSQSHNFGGQSHGISSASPKSNFSPITQSHHREQHQPEQYNKPQGKNGGKVSVYIKQLGHLPQSQVPSSSGYGQQSEGRDSGRHSGEKRGYILLPVIPNANTGVEYDIQNLQGSQGGRNAVDGRYGGDNAYNSDRPSKEIAYNSGKNYAGSQEAKYGDGQQNNQGLSLEYAVAKDQRDSVYNKGAQQSYQISQDGKNGYSSGVGGDYENDGKYVQVNNAGGDNEGHTKYSSGNEGAGYGVEVNYGNAHGGKGYGGSVEHVNLQGGGNGYEGDVSYEQIPVRGTAYESGSLHGSHGQITYGAGGGSYGTSQAGNKFNDGATHGISNGDANAGEGGNAYGAVSQGGNAYGAVSQGGNTYGTGKIHTSTKPYGGAEAYGISPSGGNSYNGGGIHGQSPVVSNAYQTGSKYGSAGGDAAIGNYGKNLASIQDGAVGYGISQGGGNSYGSQIGVKRPFGGGYNLNQFIKTVNAPHNSGSGAITGYSNIVGPSSPIRGNINTGIYGAGKSIPIEYGGVVNFAGIGHNQGGRYSGQLKSHPTVQNIGNHRGLGSLRGSMGQKNIGGSLRGIELLMPNNGYGGLLGEGRGYNQGIQTSKLFDSEVEAQIRQLAGTQSRHPNKKTKSIAIFLHKPEQYRSAGGYEPLLGGSLGAEYKSPIVDIMSPSLGLNLAGGYDTGFDSSFVPGLDGFGTQLSPFDLPKTHGRIY